MRNGQGKFTQQKGDVYEGSWKDNKRNGQGLKIYENGEKYEGLWKNDKKNGQGTLSLKDKVYY